MVDVKENCLIREFYRIYSEITIDLNKKKWFNELQGYATVF